MTPWLGTRISWLALLLMSLAANSWVVAVEPKHETWDIDGVTREALVYAPARRSTDAAPLVFVFHGHGGGARQAARSFGVHTCWPEAVVIYM